MKRIPSLDGLRAISIILVVLGHLAKSGHAPAVFWGYFAATGVRIFFVISGYLITTLLLREYELTSTIQLRVFYLRRSLRIFPAAIVFIISVSIFYRHDLTVGHFLAALFYVANYDVSRPWIFGHLWSLSIEEQFYLLWPSVLRKWYVHRTRILLGVVFISPCWSVLCYLLKSKAGLMGFPALANNLAFGCLLALYGKRLPRVPAIAAAIMTTAVAIIPFFAANTSAKTFLLLFVLNPTLYVSIAGMILHVVQRPYRLLNCAPVVWFGRISYSLYLWQQPFCSDPHLRSSAMTLLAIVCACLSYYFVEKPVLRLRDGHLPMNTPRGHERELAAVA